MAEPRPLLLRLYRALGAGLTPLFGLLFALRVRAGKELPDRRGERFGRAGLARPRGRLIWVHAASVGETMSVLPLIERLTANGAHVLLTTVTVTAAELAGKRLPDGALHQFVPYDAPGAVQRFLRHWSPDLALVVESEVWPCLFDSLRSAQVPLVLVNGRLSDGSRRNWGRAPGLARHIFGCPDLVLAQSDADAERFRALGSPHVATPGNLKFDAPEPLADTAARAELSASIGARPVWLAALTHPGEDEAVLAAYAVLRREFPDLLLCLVPRHPARADAVSELVRGRGLDLARRSRGQGISGSTSVYLGDTLGEMALFYALAPVTFLGGSFNDAGGHNPLEAAQAGSALVTGPRVANARALYKEFWKADAAVRARTPDTLADCVAALLRDPEAAAAQAARARELVEAGRGALERTLAMLAPYLDAAVTAEDGRGEGA